MCLTGSIKFATNKIPEIPFTLNRLAEPFKVVESFIDKCQKESKDIKNKIMNAEYLTKEDFKKLFEISLKMNNRIQVISLLIDIELISYNNRSSKNIKRIINRANDYKKLLSSESKF